MVLALQCAGIGPGSEVIVPTFTMIAVPNAVSFVGAHPIFVDNAAPNNYNPSLAEIKQSITSKTKAIIVTHTYGNPVNDIAQIAEECKRNCWTLIEDISECVGIKIRQFSSSKNFASKTKLLGTFGDYACASLYANKVCQFNIYGTQYIQYMIFETISGLHILQGFRFDFSVKPLPYPTLSP